MLRLIDLLVSTGSTRIVRRACAGAVVKPLRNKRGGLRWVLKAAQTAWRSRSEVQAADADEPPRRS